MSLLRFCHVYNMAIMMILTTLLIGALIVGAVLTFFVFGLVHIVPWLFVLAAAGIVVLVRRREKSEFMAWKDEYSVGIEAIDNDHRKLIKLINQFQTAVFYRTGEEFEREAFDELVDYTQTHFTREEALMEKHGYPDFEAHVAEHRKMIGQVENVMTQYQTEGRRETLNDAVLFLREWLIEHINGTDQAYSAFLLEKGER